MSGCPYDMCDGSGFVLDESTNTAFDCRCRVGRIVMAHPFAVHRTGARVDAGGHTWWGNCAWDGLGIVAALGLREATVTSTGQVNEINMSNGVPQLMVGSMPIDLSAISSVTN